MLCIPLGACVGLIAGLFGLGGGAVMVPSLTLLFLWQGMNANDAVHIALGTSMASIVMTSWVSMRQHHAKGGVRWDIWRQLLPGVVCGIFLGTFLVFHLDGRYLSWMFACFMAYVSWNMFFSVRFERHHHGLKRWHLLTVGSGIGSISALLAIGGGTMSVPFLRWQGVNMRQAIGTSAALGVPISCLGTFAYMMFSNHHSEAMGLWGLVNIPMVLIISGVSRWTVTYGVAWAHRLDEQRLKRLFAVLLMVLSLNMIYVSSG
ncbi:MAG: sulfite exporter TauE/SafE family protein [Mariprofundaceae bacterium]|nr:sulfite exporter TauE/SafE family protein [Mariprofundaceae bacterium]